MEIWAVVESRREEINEISFELMHLGKTIASKVGGTVSSVVLGYDEVDQVVDSLKQRSCVDRIICIKNKELGEYNPENFAEALLILSQKYKPDLILVGHTIFGLDFAPRLAVKLNTGVVTRCIDIKLKDGDFIFVRDIFEGKLRQEVKILTTPKIAAVSPGSQVSKEEEVVVNQEVEIIREEIQLKPKERSKMVDLMEPEVEDVDITKAEILVSGGRGLGDKENYEALIPPLAELLGGVACGSRPTADYGWIPRSRVVGTSGKTVSPKLYLAIGISGAVQHIMGIQGSKCIIAINKDPNAPIFNVAHYGVVGDLFTIVPLLIEKLKSRKHKH